MNEMMEALGDALRHLLDNGFEAPFHLAAIAVNGAALHGTYKPDGGGLVFESNHVRGDSFALPVNIMIVDGRGEAARLQIANGQKRLSLN